MVRFNVAREIEVPSAAGPPADTPEAQPAETLWTLVDEPVVNKHMPSLEALDEIISTRCAALASNKPKIKSQAGFPWRPKIANQN